MFSNTHSSYKYIIILFVCQNGGKGREVSDAKTSKGASANDGSDTESEGEEERDEESQRILESGGRDKVAYFFWQGELLVL